MLILSSNHPKLEKDVRKPSYINYFYLIYCLQSNVAIRICLFKGPTMPETLKSNDGLDAHSSNEKLKYFPLRTKRNLFFLRVEGELKLELSDSEKMLLPLRKAHGCSKPSFFIIRIENVKMYAKFI